MDCKVSPPAEISASCADLPEVEDFNFLRFTGPTYAVMKLRGSAFPHDEAGYIYAREDGTFDVFSSWGRYDDCLPTAQGHIIPEADGKPEWYLEVNNVRLGTK